VQTTTVVIANVDVLSVSIEDFNGDMSESILIVAVDWLWWYVSLSIVNGLCNCCSHFAALQASEWTMHLPSNVDMAVRGYLLIVVMIHVNQIASTRDYHSEVDTISHDAKHHLAKRNMISVRRLLAGLHLSRM
jgi:hypothetical protein